MRWKWIRKFCEFLMKRLSARKNCGHFVGTLGIENSNYVCSKNQLYKILKFIFDCWCAVCDVLLFFNWYEHDGKNRIEFLYIKHCFAFFNDLCFLLSKPPTHTLKLALSFSRSFVFISVFCKFVSIFRSCVYTPKPIYSVIINTNYVQIISFNK